MKNEAGARVVERLIRQFGCLPVLEAPGPIVPTFEPGALGRAIDQEIARAAEYGWTKITLHMDVPDAARLAAHLRRAT